MNPAEAASPPLSPLLRAAQGYGAAPPASRVATAIAARRAYGPPLTPQPLRPLTAQSARAGAQPLPARTARRSAHIKIKPLQTKSLRFQGIASLLILDGGASPHDLCGQENAAEEGQRVFVVAGGHSAPLLEPVEAAFNGVALLVDCGL